MKPESLPQPSVSAGIISGIKLHATPAEIVYFRLHQGDMPIHYFQKLTHNHLALLTGSGQEHQPQTTDHHHIEEKNSI